MRVLLKTQSDGSLLIENFQCFSMGKVIIFFKKITEKPEFLEGRTNKKLIN